MERTVGISGKSAGVYQQTTGGIGTAVTELGHAGQSLGASIEKRHQDKLILEGKIQAYQDKSQTDLYKKQAEDRAEVFIASQKDVWDNDKLKENQDEYERQERNQLTEARKNGVLSEGAFFSLSDYEMPIIYSNTLGKTTEQVHVAKVNNGISNYTQLMTSFNSQGDIEGANAQVDAMLAMDYISPNKARELRDKNVKESTKGLILLDIGKTNNQVTLQKLYKRVSDLDDYKGQLDLDDRVAIQAQIIKRQEEVVRTEQLPNINAMGDDIKNGRATPESLAASNIPPAAKIVFQNQLQSKINKEYNTLTVREKGKLTLYIDDWQQGTGLWGLERGGKASNLETLMEYVNKIGVGDEIYNELTTMITTGLASDAMMQYLDLEDKNSKYPSKIRDHMATWRKEFNFITRDMSAPERAEYAEFSYTYMYDNINGLDFSSMSPTARDIPVENRRDATSDATNVIRKSLEPARERRAYYDLIKQSEATLGIISNRSDPLIGYQSEGQRLANQKTNPDEVVPVQLENTPANRALISGYMSMFGGTLENAEKMILEVNK